MFKKKCSQFILALAFIVLATPAGKMYAGTSITLPTVVSGGDPQPSGSSVSSLITLLSVLMSV